MVYLPKGSLTMLIMPCYTLIIKQAIKQFMCQQILISALYHTKCKTNDRFNLRRDMTLSFTQYYIMDVRNLERLASGALGGLFGVALLDGSGSSKLGVSELGGGGEVRTVVGDSIGHLLQALLGVKRELLLRVKLGRLVESTSLWMEETNKSQINVERRDQKWCKKQTQTTRSVPAKYNRRNTYLLLKSKVSRDVDSSLVGKSTELGRVNVQHIARLTGESDSTGTGSALSLDEKGVVILDEFPDESRGHGCDAWPFLWQRPAPPRPCHTRL